jgi:hypothetical protein
MLFLPVGFTNNLVKLLFDPFQLISPTHLENRIILLGLGSQVTIPSYP